MDQLIDVQYVWFIWSSLFIVPWAIVYAVFPKYRFQMWRAAIYTAPFGLTEPLFVPEYWNPPTLFNLAQNTGFDIESLIFCFGIGGICVVLYNILTRKDFVEVEDFEKHSSRHRFHKVALFSPFLIFISLVFFDWNAIYPGILAMAGGSIATIYCRPDLKNKTWVGGVLFTIYYYIFLIGLEWLSPGYVDKYWNLEQLTGIKVLDFPVEEFLFAFTFGMYWSSVYEHLYWKKTVS